MKRSPQSFWPSLSLATLIALVVVVSLVASVSSAQPAQHDLAARIDALERAVTSLQAVIARPAPPATTQTDGAFTFQRITVIQQSSSSFAEVVGEVIAPRTEDRVRLRATMYAEDGSIVATETFTVSVVEGRPRAFDVLMTGVHLTATRVASVGMQVE